MTKEQFEVTPDDQYPADCYCEEGCTLMGKHDVCDPGTSKDLIGLQLAIDTAETYGSEIVVIHLRLAQRIAENMQLANEPRDVRSAYKNGYVDGAAGFIGNEDELEGTADFMASKYAPAQPPSVDLESEEFFNLMQTYRCMPTQHQDKVIEVFEAVKAYLRAAQPPLPNPLAAAGFAFAGLAKDKTHVLKLYFDTVEECQAAFDYFNEVSEQAHALTKCAHLPNQAAWCPTCNPTAQGE